MTAFARALSMHIWRFDRVWLTTLILFVGIAAIFPAKQLPTSLVFTAEALLHIVPYLLFSALMSGYLVAAGADKMVGVVLRGRPLPAIGLAALVGAVSPFCSCGVIPLIVAALSAGVPLPAVMAFWLASPLMAPDMYVITTAALGADFATAKTAAAVGIGLLGGLAMLALTRADWFKNPLRPGVGNGGCGGAAIRDRVKPHWRVWNDAPRRQKLYQGSRDSVLFLIKWLTLAFAIESLMVAYLPIEMVGAWLGGDNMWAVPLSVLVGIPAYMNGYAAIPIVAGLIEGGMSQGAALAFMTAGGVTSIPAAMAVFAVAKRSVFIAYLLLAVVGATASGMLWQMVAG